MQGIKALVEFREQWYRVEDDQNLTSRSLHFFDKVVTIKDNNYNVIKDRRGNHQGHTGMIDMLIVQLFADGKTLYDLPLYYEDVSQPYGPLNLHFDDEGNLVAMDINRNYEQTN